MSTSFPVTSADGPPISTAATFHVATRQLVVTFDEPCQWATLAASAFVARKITSLTYASPLVATPGSGLTLTLTLDAPTVQAGNTHVLDYAGTTIKSSATGLFLAPFANHPLTII